MPATLAYGTNRSIRTIQEASSWPACHARAAHRDPPTGRRRSASPRSSRRRARRARAQRRAARLAGGLAAAHRSGEIRGRRAAACATGSTAWRCCIASRSPAASVSYGNRYLQSRAYRAAREQGRIAYGEFATDPCRSLFKRVQTLFAPGSDAARQRQRQRHPARRAVHRDDRDADAGAVRRADAGDAGVQPFEVPGSCRPPTRTWTARAADAQLRGQARAASAATASSRVDRRREQSRG